MKYSFIQLNDFEKFRNVLRKQKLDTLLPSIKELESIVSLRQIKLIMFCVLANKKLLAAVPLFIERRQIHKVQTKTLSIIGHDFFDYNFFYCNKKVERFFFKNIKREAKALGVDLIVIENVATEVRKLEGDVFMFDTQLSPTKDFSSLLKKKSLKRHHNKAKREMNYTCTHKQAHFDQLDISELAHLHKERWAFDNVQSAFLNRGREDLYSCHKDNKVLSVISDGDEIVAIHYGMLLGNVFLWHTPVLNIKYLNYSPIELLLYEVVNFCKLNGLNVLDFGLGDERYKLRFSNSKRKVLTELHPASYKGWVCYLLSRLKHKKFAIHGIKRFVKRLFGIFNNINFYTYKNQGYLEVRKNTNFLLVDEYKNFIELLRNNNFLINRYQHARFNAGCYFYCLLDGNRKILCSGWGTRSEKFHISEINKTIQNKNTLMLYDFTTPDELRGNGFYKTLLKHICNKYRDEKIVIFAEKKNFASNRAIASVGFVPEKHIGG